MGKLLSLVLAGTLSTCVFEQIQRLNSVKVMQVLNELLIFHKRPESLQGKKTAEI